MSRFKIKKKSQLPITKLTRIEVRCGGKSKVLTLEHVNAHQLYKHLYNKLSSVHEQIKIDLPIVDSPVSHVEKCRVQVFEATSEAISKKENFKSFTCYGIDNDRVMELITKFIQES